MGLFDKRKKKYENGDELPYTGPWKNGEKVSFNEYSGNSSSKNTSSYTAQYTTLPDSRGTR